MPWRQRIRSLIGRPVGISLIDGTGTAGILCDVRDNTLYVMEFMYQDQFAMKQYPFEYVDDVNAYPRCNSQPRPPLY